jgi:hypothetical protein
MSDLPESFAATIFSCQQDSKTNQELTQEERSRVLPPRNDHATRGWTFPCFPICSAHRDWGMIEAPKMDFVQLQKVKKDCAAHCFSALNHILAFCYNDTGVTRWQFKETLCGFEGVHGNME